MPFCDVAERSGMLFEMLGSSRAKSNKVDPSHFGATHRTCRILSHVLLYVNSACN